MVTALFVHPIACCVVCCVVTRRGAGIIDTLVLHAQQRFEVYLLRTCIQQYEFGRLCETPTALSCLVLQQLLLVLLLVRYFRHSSPNPMQSVYYTISLCHITTHGGVRLVYTEAGRPGGRTTHVCGDTSFLLL